MNKTKKKLKNDLILCLCLLVAAGILWAVFSLTRSPGAYAVVTVDGKETVRYPLSENCEVWISGVNGGQNLLNICDGSAIVSEASCPDKICVHQGPISRSGETITCLPNRVMITIIGGYEGVDTVA